MNFLRKFEWEFSRKFVVHFFSSEVSLIKKWFSRIAQGFFLTNLEGFIYPLSIYTINTTTQLLWDRCCSPAIGCAVVATWKSQLATPAPWHSSTVRCGGPPVAGAFTSIVFFPTKRRQSSILTDHPPPIFKNVSSIWCLYRLPRNHGGTYFIPVSRVL